MKAIFSVPHPEGGRFELRETDVPQAGPGQVLVKVAASAINRGELTGVRAARQGEAAITGLEFSGEVVEAGAGVRRFRAGDAVMGQFRSCHAEYIAIHEGLVLPKPQALDWQEAAAFPNCYVTAHDALVTNGAFQPGEAVLVNAASSGIGVAAIQIAAALGAGKVIGTSTHAAKLAKLYPLGLSDGIDTSAGEPLHTRVLALTEGKGVDVIVDSIGASVFDENLKSLALKGRLVGVGRMGGKNASIDLDFVSLRRLKLIGVTFRTRTLQERIDCIQHCGHDLLPLIESGKIRPVVQQAFPAERIEDAARLMESGTHVGKIVVLF